MYIQCSLDAAKILQTLFVKGNWRLVKQFADPL